MPTLLYLRYSLRNRDIGELMKERCFKLVEDLHCQL